MKTFFKPFALIIFLCSVFFTTPQVFAQEKINEFHSNITAHKDGSMTIEENITYDFGDSDRHGIFRTIPRVSKVGDLYRVIEVDFAGVKRDGRDEEYEVDQETGETEIKIGDPDKTITGQHNYIIIYTVKNGIGSNYDDHDEIYWNVTGNDWQIPIEKASANLLTDFGAEANKVACFTRPGNFNAQFCNFAQTPPFNPIVTTDTLQPGDGLTIVAGFPVNTFPKSTLQTSEPAFDPDFINILKIYFPIALILNLLVAPYLIFWYFSNKSKQRLGPPTVNFDIPKDATGKIIPPAEAGIIDNHKLEREDIVATIFDLAIRKYIKIEETKKVKMLRPDELDYQIIKLKSYGDVHPFEKELLGRLFQDGDKVFLKDLKSDFYLTFQSLENEIFDSLEVKGFYGKNPKNQMGALLGFGIAALVLGNIILGPVLIFLSRKLNGRSELGDKIDWQVDGLKIFLKAVDRYHKFQSKNLITVEKYIPYAIALGLQDEFMAQLKIIYPDYKPNWYSGPHGFYHVYPGMYSNFGTGVTTSAPSSSSGFGGGSGGGGGGGGGGSW